MKALHRLGYFNSGYRLQALNGEYKQSFGKICLCSSGGMADTLVAEISAVWCESSNLSRSIYKKK